MLALFHRSNTFVFATPDRSANPSDGSMDGRIDGSTDGRIDGWLDQSQKGEKIEDEALVVAEATFAGATELRLSAGKKRHGIVELQ